MLKRYATKAKRFADKAKALELLDQAGILNHYAKIDEVLLIKNLGRLPSLLKEQLDPLLEETVISSGFRLFVEKEGFNG